MHRTNARLLAVFTALVSLPALAHEEGKLSPALGLLAKTHLLLLHFPIAMLFAVLFVELLLRKKVPAEKRTEVMGVLMMVAAGGAVVAAATGLLYAADEDWHGHAETMMVQHRTGGIVTAVFTVLAFVAQRMPKLRVAYLPLLALAAIGVTVTGHKGGELVHGEGYLFESFDKDKHGDEEGPDRIVASDGDEPVDEQRLRWPEGATPEKPDYAKDIQPLIQRSCVKCHGPEKRKSGLRLDKKRYALKGGETGPAVVPGDLEKSLLVKYISLPQDDEDVMPSKGKLLAQSEIETFKKWVAQGAVWPDDEK